MAAPIELVTRMFEMFSTGDTSAAEEIVTDVYDEHGLAPFSDREPGRVEGAPQLRSTVGWLRAQFPDLRMTIEAAVVEGELIAVRVHTTGTNLGPINGVIPPTGRTFSARQSHWFRVSDGRLAEHWATRDDLTGMIQLGLIPVPGASPVA